MRYTVLWSPAAEEDLIEIWIRADDRMAVTHAVDQFDAALARDPNNQGESRQERIRVTFAGPLDINFEVNEHDRQVRVIAVWQVRRRA